jgi:hypothetical protein
MEFDQRVIIRLFCQECAFAEGIHLRLDTYFGQDACSPGSVRRWRHYVRQGSENLWDKARPGEPPIDFLDVRVLSLLDKQPSRSAYSIADALGVSIRLY